MTLLLFFLMDEISQIEKVLGNSYGNTPRILNNTFANRFNEYVKGCRYSPKVFLKGLFQAYVLRKDSLYYEKSHAILLGDDNLHNSSYSEYMLLHELGHGYIGQRSPIFREAGERLGEGFHGSLSEKEFEELFLVRCVYEGIADYLAIQSQKLQAMNGRKPKELYGFDREWSLTYFKELKEVGKITKSSPLSYDIATALERNGSRLIKIIINPDKGKQQDKSKRYLAYCLDNFSYVFGHYFVRARCGNKIEDIADDIDKIIGTLPKSLEELQHTVLSVFR